MHVPSTRGRALAPLLAVAIAAACGGDSGPTGAPPLPTVTSLQVTPRSAELMEGATQPLTATARDSAGNTIGGATLTWTSSNTAVATVSSTGVVTGVSLGTATIRVTSGAKADSVALTVKAGGSVTASGGTVASNGGGVKLTVPAGAVSSGTTITVEPARDTTNSPNVVAGTVYEFGPDGTQFAQPVTLELSYNPAQLPAGVPPSALRIAKLVGDEWQILTEGVMVDSASAKVRASIRSFSSYAIVADPCRPMGTIAGVSTWNGSLTRFDCEHPVTGRFADYYTVNVASWPANQQVTIDNTASFTGTMGIKTAAPFVFDSTIWLARSLGSTLRIVTNGTPLQLYVSASDTAILGTYSLTTSVGPVTHACGQTGIYLMPGVTFSQALNPQNSCRVTIQHSPFPEAIGQPIDVHYYYARLTAGKTHTITLSGLTSNFYPGLTIFQGNQVVAQSVASNPGSSRTLTVTPTANAYYAIEVSSGTMRNGSWEIQTGTYTLTTSP